MKILAVVGSKKGGNTDRLTQQFIKGALSAGHDVGTEYLFTKKNLHGCIDCQTCKKNGGVCVWKDDLPEMLDRLIASDVLVFASPVYFFSISSQLKLFMDRTYAVMEKIKNKKFYLIATAEGPSDLYVEDFKKVSEPVQGWLDCFEGMTFEKAIYCFDMGTIGDITKADAYREAFTAGEMV